MQRKPYTRYSREFKLEAVGQAALGEKPKAQIARALGIRVGHLRERRLQFEQEASKGDCWDNAPMESFFHTLKTELVMHCDYKTRDQARASLFDYMEVFNNRQRRHSTLNYEAPLARGDANRLITVSTERG
jgi:transposase-like protein